MKKIVALVAIASLACGMIFADEPVVDTKIAEFNGNAEVKWGVDLDAGQHGFKNSTKTKLKMSLWNEGTVETSGDGLWAEIQVKTGESKIEGEDKAPSTSFGDLSIEAAKIHYDDFYVDIRSGNTQVGEFKPDTALHSDTAWLNNAGLEFKNGIQVGYDPTDFKFSLDFRSYKADNTDYTSAYGIAFNAGLKDSLVPGLTVDAGVGVNLSTDYKDCGSEAIDGVEATNTQADLDKHAAAILDWDKGIATDHSLPTGLKNGHQIAYAFKAAYKLAIDDAMFVKPSAGFRGSYTTGTDPAADKAVTSLENEVAVGVLFGWGDVNVDAAAGVPFLNDNGEKKVSPGVGVVAYIPLDTIDTFDDVKTTTTDALTAVIVPSFYLGDDKVEGLKAAAYGEIGLYKYVDPKDYLDPVNAPGVLKDSKEKDILIKGSVKENETTAIAFAAGLSYGITLDSDATVTPNFGFRYANGAYVSNGLMGKYSDIFKSDLGFQNTFFEKAEDAAKQTYTADFFNLKIGCDFAGFIDNTTFSLNYNSANLLNGIGEEKSAPAYAKDTKYYNVKLGTFTVGCKIAY